MAAINRTYSADYRAGLIGALAGESLGKAVDRALAQAQKDGQRLVFMVRDGWSIWRWIATFLGFVLSLGLWGRTPGYLLVTEGTAAKPSAEPQAPGQPAAAAPRPLPAPTRDQVLECIRTANGTATAATVANKLMAEPTAVSSELDKLAQEGAVAVHANGTCSAM